MFLVYRRNKLSAVKLPTLILFYPNLTLILKRLR